MRPGPVSALAGRRDGARATSASPPPRPPARRPFPCRASTCPVPAAPRMGRCSDSALVVAMLPASARGERRSFMTTRRCDIRVFTFSSTASARTPTAGAAADRRHTTSAPARSLASRSYAAALGGGGLGAMGDALGVDAWRRSAAAADADGLVGPCTCRRARLARVPRARKARCSAIVALRCAQPRVALADALARRRSAPRSSARTARSSSTSPTRRAAAAVRRARIDNEPVWHIVGGGRLMAASPAPRATLLDVDDDDGERRAAALWAAIAGRALGGVAKRRAFPCRLPDNLDDDRAVATIANDRRGAHADAAAPPRDTVFQRACSPRSPSSPSARPPPSSRRAPRTTSSSRWRAAPRGSWTSAGRRRRACARARAGDDLERT